MSTSCLKSPAHHFTNPPQIQNKNVQEKKQQMNKKFIAKYFSSLCNVFNQTRKSAGRFECD